MSIIHVKLPNEYNNIKSITLKGIEYINDNYSFEENDIVCVPISRILNQSRPSVSQG
jgi:hypothetical protein